MQNYDIYIRSSGTFESRLGLQVLPRAVGALGQADDDRRRVAIGRICDGNYHQRGTNAEEKLLCPCHVWMDGWMDDPMRGRRGNATAYIGV